MKISEEGNNHSFDATTSNSGTFAQAPSILHSLLGVLMSVQAMFVNIEVRKSLMRSEKFVFQKVCVHVRVTHCYASYRLLCVTLIK